MAVMTDKVCLITGATSGVGLETARGLAALGAQVWAHGRNAEKGRAVVEDLVRSTGNADIHFLQADFADLEDVRRLGGELATALPRLDVLVNNAGLMNTRFRPSAQGWELTFAVNHMAPFLLTSLLLEKLKATAPARVVTVSSEAHRRARIEFDDLTGEKRFSLFHAYGASKLANILFTRALARRLEGTGVTATCLHPGVVRTAFFGNGMMGKVVTALFGGLMLTPEQGARTSVYLASSPEAARFSGGYYDRCAPRAVAPAGEDDAAAERLWAESARLAGLAA